MDTPPCVAGLMSSRRGSGDGGGGDSDDAAQDECLVFGKPDYGSQLLRGLAAQRADACLTDAVVCAAEGGPELACHRSVLAASSAYFAAMFGGELRESHERRVVLSGVTAASVSALLDYAYTGRVSVRADNAQDLLAAAALLQYPDVVGACCDWLEAHLTPANCLGVSAFAQLHGCATLAAAALHTALDGFDAVRQTDEFRALSRDALVAYLSSDELEVRCEEAVHAAALTWLGQDPAGRRAHACAANATVRLSTVAPAYLDAVVSRDPHVAACAQCSALVVAARRGSGDRRRGSAAAAVLPRPSTVAKDVMVVVGGRDTAAVDMYEPAKDKWQPLPDLPEPAPGCSVAALHNDIYVTGGLRRAAATAAVWRFRAADRRWEAAPALLAPRMHHASAVWGGRLYVIGGVAGKAANGRLADVETIECFDGDAWRLVGQSPYPRRRAHLAPYKQTLVEVGGTQADVQVPTMESYECSDDGRHVRYSGEQFLLPESIRYAQIVVLGGVFYIVWEDTRRLISLDLQRRTFRHLADMPTAHRCGGATTLAGRLYVTGGFDGGGGAGGASVSGVTECYDPETDTWTRVAAARLARVPLGCVTIQMT